MSVAVVGLGYVGLPLAIAFAKTGRPTIGYDVARSRLAELALGRDRNGDVSAEELDVTGLVFTSDPSELLAAEAFVITVPTPVTPVKRPDLGPLLAASRAVGRALRQGDLVVVESTVFPGATREEVLPLLEQESGLRAGSGFLLAYSPERINPGDQEHGLDRVIKVVAGFDAASLSAAAELYRSVVGAGLHLAPSMEAAELAKVFENTQRDVNIALMNELALVCDKLELRSHDVLEAARTKWNFLDFQPGLVGGHCIGVDPYYLVAKAQALGHHPEVISAGRRINDGMGRFIGQRTAKLLADVGTSPRGARVGILGVTFKANFGDVRNSKVADVIAELEAFGASVVAHDPWVSREQAAAELGVELVDWSELIELDALVVAVKHREFIARGPDAMCATLARPGVLVDVKSIIEPSAVPAGVRHWSL